MIPVSPGTARIILLAWAIVFGPLILLVAAALAGEWLAYRAHKRRGAARAMDQAVASMCKPCHGEPGTCTCPRKCGHPMCGGRKSTVTEPTLTYFGHCARGCPDGECYCAEPTYAEMNDMCPGCGAMDGECYCGEE